MEERKETRKQGTRWWFVRLGGRKGVAEENGRPGEKLNGGGRTRIYQRRETRR